ncbi:hypothetical protein ATE67_03810 [Sphingopyxis sp. H050]|nr:hypothetical protein ATE67_03810 [Sphingopyxis sp. H050]
MIRRLVRRVHDPDSDRPYACRKADRHSPVADVIDDRIMPLVRIGRVRQFDGRAPILFHMSRPRSTSPSF